MKDALLPIARTIVATNRMCRVMFSETLLMHPGLFPARALNSLNECQTHERVLRPWAVYGYYDAGVRADYWNSTVVINYDEISESFGSVRSTRRVQISLAALQILRTIRSSP